MLTLRKMMDNAEKINEKNAKMIGINVVFKESIVCQFGILSEIHDHNHVKYYYEHDLDNKLSKEKYIIINIDHKLCEAEDYFRPSAK